MNMAFVFEDDQAVRQDLSEAIRACGWECCCAGMADGPETLRLKGGPRLGAVFASLSAGLPEALFKTAKSMDPQAFIVAIADLDQDDLLFRALERGLADEFLALPFSRADIAGILKLVGGAR